MFATYHGVGRFSSGFIAAGASTVNLPISPLVARAGACLPPSNAQKQRLAGQSGREQQQLQNMGASEELCTVSLKV